MNGAPVTVVTPAAVTNQPSIPVGIPVGVPAAANNSLTEAFNNAYNGGQTRRAVYNICDANRVLPGVSPVMVSSLWALVTKVPVTNSINVVRQLANIAITKGANCTAASKAMDLSADYTAGLGNYFGTVPVCNRTLRRNEMNDDYIRANMTDSAEYGLDSDILSGAFADNTGLKGIIGDAGTVELDFCTIGAALGHLLPRDLANATIVMRPSDWYATLENNEQLKGCCTVFVNGVPEMRYLGTRVVPSVALPDTVFAVIGNFARYVAGYDRQAAITADTSRLFDEDKTLFKVQVEAGGGSNATKKTVNGVESSSFVTILADE